MKNGIGAFLRVYFKFNLPPLQEILYLLKKTYRQK